METKAPAILAEMFFFFKAYLQFIKCVHDKRAELI